MIINVSSSLRSFVEMAHCHFSIKNPRQEITQLTYKFHRGDIGEYLAIFPEFVYSYSVRSFDVESTVNWELVPVLFRRQRSPRVALRVVCPPSLACVRVFCCSPACHRIRDYSQSKLLTVISHQRKFKA